MGAQTVAKIVDEAWFRDRLYALNMSQRELARKTNLDGGKLNKILKGSRKVTPDEVSTIATALGVSYDEVLGRMGIRPPQDPDDVPIKYEIVANGMVVPAVEKLGYAPRPPRTGANLAAAVNTDRNSPGFGTVYFWEPASPRSVSPETLDRLSVVTLADGSMRLRVIRTALQSGMYALMYHDRDEGDAIARVDSAARVLWTTSL